MDFSISLFVVFFFKVLIGDAAITTLKVGDSFACNCTFSNKRDLTWTLQRVNGETVPLVWKCIFPYTNCTVRYYDGNLKVIYFMKFIDYFRNNYPITTELTLLHVEQDMLLIFCSNYGFPDEVENCMMNVVDNTGATSIDSPIHTLNKGDQFTCVCNLFGSSYLSWTLQHVNGGRPSMITECDEPYRFCKIKYNPTNFIIETKDENAGFQKNTSTFPMFVSKLTVKHVDKDMLRLVCSSGIYENAQCLMNVVDYSGSDKGTKSTDPSTTPSPDVTKNPVLPFPTTPYRFFLSTSPNPASASELALLTALPLFLSISCFTLIGCCCWCRKKTVQREGHGITLIRNSLWETPAAFPDQSDPYSTHVDPPVDPSNNTLTTESQQHTASIQSPVPKDSPPPYSSLLELRVEPPPYTTLTAESYNCESTPSHEAQNVPPPYTTRYTATYNSVSPSAQQQAQNVPPPYTTRSIATHNSVSPSAQQQAQNVPPPYTTRSIATHNSVSPSAQQQAQNVPPPYTTQPAERYNCESAPSQQTPNEPPAYNTLTVNTVSYQSTRL